MPTPVPHRVDRARHCRRARRSHRTTVTRATHTLATRHTLASWLAPSAAAYLFACPAVAPLPRAPSCHGHLLPAAPSTTPAACLACCVLLPAAMRCSTAGMLLRHVLDTVVDKHGGGIANGV